MVSLIVTLRTACRVDQFSYLICSNQTPVEKIMRFGRFQISQPTHIGQIDLAYWFDRAKQI
jgi:hypothetical protein